MRKQSILIVIFCWSFIGQALPQQPINTSNVDRESYSLFLAKDWDGLIDLGNLALSHHVDFYYLRYRLGAAWFEKGNYHQAIHHLEKAYKENPTDPSLKTLLYYANLYLNRSFEANTIAASLSRQHQAALGIKPSPFIKRLDITYNQNYNDNADSRDPFFEDADPNLNGTQFLSTGHQYIHVALLHPITPGFSIYHGYTYVNKKHFLYSQFDGLANSSETWSRLNQYYISGNVRLGKGLTLSTGMHYMHIRLPVDIETGISSKNNYAGFASLYKQLRFITLGGSVYISGLNDARQLQGDVLLAYYPLGNLNLYTVSTISTQVEQHDLLANQNRFIIHQSLGGKLANHLWVEGFVSFGNMQNFLRHDGLVVFNAMDEITEQYGLKLIIPVNTRIGLNIDGTYFKHNSVFEPTIPDHQTLNSIQYHSVSFTGGLTWTL